MEFLIFQDQRSKFLSKYGPGLTQQWYVFIKFITCLLCYILLFIVK